MISAYVKGIGLIVGLMFGAGIFALPFAIARAGIFWGLIHLLIAVSLTLLLLFLYAETAYYTKGTHRFIGYVELILGKKFKIPAFLITIAAYYGALLAYGVLAGLFLSNFLPFVALAKVGFTFLFFAICAILLLLKLGKIALINFYLTIPLFGFVVYLLFASLPFIDLNNFALSLKDFSMGNSWFLPYGIWLFSLGAFAAIPEARDVFVSSTLKNFKKIILISVLLSTFFYCLFIFAIMGISGNSTSEDAISGVLSVLGFRVILAGSVMGLLAVFTSFLALGMDLRGIFRYDFGFSKILAWFFVVAPPIVLFSVGIQSFTRILGFVGSFGIGFTGIFIILMAQRLRRKGRVLEVFAIIAISIAVVYEILNLL